jgi:hypothetical protein
MAYNCVVHSSIKEIVGRFRNCCFLLFILTANGFISDGSGTTIRRNTQITHNAQTKHSTQNYTNNEGHTTHNEYNYNYTQ